MRSNGNNYYYWGIWTNSLHFIVVGTTIRTHFPFCFVFVLFWSEFFCGAKLYRRCTKRTKEVVVFRLTQFNTIINSSNLISIWFKNLNENDENILLNKEFYCNFLTSLPYWNLSEFIHKSLVHMVLSRYNLKWAFLPWQLYMVDACLGVKM